MQLSFYTVLTQLAGGATAAAHGPGEFTVLQHHPTHVLLRFGLLWTKKKRSCAFWLLHNPSGTHFDTEIELAFWLAMDKKEAKLRLLVIA